MCVCVFFFWLNKACLLLMKNNTLAHFKLHVFFKKTLMVRFKGNTLEIKIAIISVGFWVSTLIIQI